MDVRQIEKILEENLKGCVDFYREGGYGRALNVLSRIKGLRYICNSNTFMGARSFAPNHYYYHPDSGKVVVVTYSYWDIVPVERCPQYVQELIQELLREHS